MKRAYSVVAALVFVPAVYGDAHGQPGHEASDVYDQQVQAIVDKGQLRSGELVENLAALGSDAIPALHRAMLREDEAFPLTYIKAFGIIGDVRATVPLLDFLERRRPFTDPNERTLTIHTLLVLARIGDRLSDPLIEEIFRSHVLHPRIRLYAAAALTKAKEDALRREAKTHVLEQYVNAAAQTPDPNERILDTDFYEALIVMNDESSVQHLATALRGHPLPHTARRIIKYFSTTDDPNAVNALLAVVDDGYNHEMVVRLSALEAAVGKINEATAHSKARMLSAEAVEGSWSTDDVKRAADLVARTGKN